MGLGFELSTQEHFAKIAVEAVMRLKENAASLDLIHILKKPGGCLRDSYLDEGFVLEKRIGRLQTLDPKSQPQSRT